LIYFASLKKRPNFAPALARNPLSGLLVYRNTTKNI